VCRRFKLKIDPNKDDSSIVNWLKRRGLKEKIDIEFWPFFPLVGVLIMIATTCLDGENLWKVSCCNTFGCVCHANNQELIQTQYLSWPHNLETSSESVTWT
jgi:hypothetical protein